MIKKNLRHKIHVLEAEKDIDHSVALTKAPNKEDCQSPSPKGKGLNREV